MAPTDVAIWTEHETKTINSTSKPCTMVMYRTIGSKYITGLYVPSILLKSGSNFPLWNNAYQSATDGLLAGPTTITTNWQVKSTLQNTNDPTTNRLLLAGTTTQAVSYSGSISSTNYKSTFANFVDTTFSIGPGLQVANITGGLHSSLATDKLAQMTPNNFSSFVLSKEYDSLVITDNSYHEQTTSFTKLWSGSPNKSNTFYVNSSGLQFNTINWGSSGGLILEDMNIFQGIRCVGSLTGTKSTQLDSLGWTNNGSTSTYTPLVTGGETADIYFPTHNDPTTGFTPGQSATAYIRFNNTNLNNDNVVKGTYIYKLNMNSYTFIDGLNTVDRNFSLPALSLNLTGNYSLPGFTDEAKGAKITLNWSIPFANLNRIYKQTDGSNLTDTTGTEQVSYTKNIRRIRTDSGAGDNRLQDVLYLGSDIANAISILSDKIWTTTVNNSIVDTYGLWFNARYTYYIDAYNVITGDTIMDKNVSVTTGPGTPINWQEAQVAEVTLNPSIQMEWQNPSATGTASSIYYKITKLAYDISGIDVSGNVTQTGSFPVTTYDNIATPSYTSTSYETLLYNKKFTYKLQAKVGGTTSSELTKTFTVPDDSSGNAALDWQLDASQNEVANILQSFDYEGNPLTYQNNYVVITVPETSYTFADSSSPTEYQIFEKYKLIATIPKAKVDASGNKIIFSRYWLNDGNSSSIVAAYETGIFLNVIAANPGNGQYSVVGTTKYIKTLAQPKLPYPMPVTSITATGGLNNILLNWNVPLDSTDANTPATYNYISSILVYAIINTNETDGHYDTTDPTFDFSTIAPDVSNTIDNTKYRIVATLGSGIRTFTDGNVANKPLWDNEIVGYRIVTKNSQEIFSGQDPNNSTSGDILWGTTQTDISGSKYRESSASHPDLYIFGNTHVQAKTSAPVQAGPATMGGGTSRNNVNASWTVPGTYSKDTPLAYSVRYIYNSVLAGGVLTPSNSQLVPVPAETATTVNSITSNNITELLPGSDYTVYTIVYTNMEETHADDNKWTASDEASNSYTTTQNTVGTSNYQIDATNYENNVSVGFPIPLIVGHSVYQQAFSGNMLTWKHPQYFAYEWAIANDGTITCPAHMLPKWKINLVSGAAPTVFNIGPNNDLIAGYSIQNGDIIAVFDVASGYCVDSYIWHTSDGETYKTLKCDKDTTGSSGFKFQLWKTSDNTIHNLYVTSYDLDNRPKGGSIVTNPTSQLTKIDAGPSDSLYINLQFEIVPNKYRIYHNGKLITTVIDTLEYDITQSSLSDTEKNNYDITWYSDNTGLTSRSSVTSWTSASESQKWTAYSITGNLVEEPYVIKISNPIKSNVQYDPNNGDNLALGDNGTMEFTFNNNEWNNISFNVVDTTKTTIHVLFESITSLSTSNDEILIYDFKWQPYNYKNGAWSGTNNQEIDYDQGYMVKLFTATSRTLTISGKKIRGINLQVLPGWNFMGHPYSQAKTGNIVTSNVGISGITLGQTLWSNMYIVYNPAGASLKGPLYSIAYGGINTSSNSYGDTGVMTFNVGSMYTIRVKDLMTLLIGSLAAFRNKGDFNGDTNVTAADYIALANYLVKINPDYKTIADDIITEANSTNYFANIKSKIAETVGLNDLVYLISYVNSNSSIGFPEENAK